MSARTSAVERLQTWWALVGPVPSPIPAGIITKPHDRTRALDRAYKVGPLCLRPGEALLTEYVRSGPESLDGITTFESWPIVVEREHDLGELGDTLEAGRRYAEGEAVARGEGAPALHRLCGLLSLAWGEAWQVRTAPRFASRMSPRVPASWEPPDRSCLSSPPEPRPAPLPDWVMAAWDRLDGDPSLERSLSMWHQGQMLVPSSPSFALVAFTSSIEAAGCALGFARESGKSTGSTGEILSGTTGRFWETVALVRNDAQVRELKSVLRLYKRRSQTVHGAHLHGIEPIYGDWFLFDQKLDGSWTVANQPYKLWSFVLKAVPRVCAVASDLLLRALSA